MQEFDRGIMLIYKQWLGNKSDTEDNRKEFIKIIENHYSR